VWNRQFRSSPWLWAAFSLAAFAVAGYLLEIPVGKERAKYWELACGVARMQDVPSRGFLAMLLVFWGMVLAVPCLGVGWVLQAAAQILLPRKTQERRRNEATHGEGLL
jgi:hypothetical protein